MTLEKFIEENRSELQATISRYLNHVPKTASCRCYKSGTDHYHDDAPPLDDDELRLWILNDEGLYNWARREGVNEDNEEENDDN
jgi:hypothetical protein